MSYIVFARKWRPQDFDEVISQEHIITTLENAISNDRVAHAYIFTGPRGIGKTSVARIFAKSLNCEKGPATSPCNKCISCNSITSGTSMDVIEIDGASNNSVDQVRELRENIKFMPSYGRYKIYIIDEVHMLSIGAFNALLKTLEEPPKHAKFIFATTQPEKVPPTILSRCQRFDFRRIPLKMMISKLEKIAKTEKLNISEDAIFAIARAADGSLRDAESVFDQLAAFCEKKIIQEDVITLLGVIEEDKLADIVERLSKKDTAGLLKAIDELIVTGKDISQFLTGLMGYLRNLMVLKVSPDLTSLIELPDSHIARLKEQAKNFQIDELLYAFYTISATANAIKRSEVSRFIVEAALIKLSLRGGLMSLPEIMDRIAYLEANFGRHVPPASPSSAEYDTHPAKREGLTKAEGEDIPPIEDKTKAEAREVMEEGGHTASEAKLPESIEGPPDNNNENKKSAEAESAAKPAEIALLTKESVSKKWPELLHMIKGKRMSIASYLLEGEIIEVNDSVITIGFAKKFNFNKEALEYANNKKFIENVFFDIFGLKVRLSLVILEGAEAAPGQPDDSSGLDIEEELEHEAKKGVFDEPIIQSAMDIFDGRIIKGEEGFFRPGSENDKRRDKGEHPSR